MTSDDDIEAEHGPWPLIADAARDARRILGRAWPLVLACALVQSVSLAAGYALLNRAFGVTAPPGGTAFALAGAALCVIAGGLLGVPPARRAAATLFVGSSGPVRPIDVPLAYRAARPAYRSAAARLAFLGIGLLAVAFAGVLIGAVLIAVGGIVGNLITAIATLVLVPALGVAFVPLSHLLWARVCVCPGNPQGDLMMIREALRTPDLRGEGGVWGAAVLVVTTAMTSLFLVIVAAIGLAAGEIGCFIAGTALLMPLLALHWALGLRYARVVHDRGLAVFDGCAPRYSP